MVYFKVVNIEPPYRIEVFKVGTIQLDTITDELAEQLWKDKCPYLALTDEGRAKYFPNQKPISTDKISVETITTKKSSQKKQ